MTGALDKHLRIGVGDSMILEVRDLGKVAYAESLALQRGLHGEVVAGRDGDAPAKSFLLLLEHDPPVITVSGRRTSRQHLIATPAQLEHAGVEVAETDRGGDITYHGPGQLVVYPIIDLNALGLRLHGYMRFLEHVVIKTLARFGIDGARDESATGVWVGRSKICAMGVRVSRWVSMHGLALNIETTLEHFNLIVPCGLAGRGVTSMKRELAGRCPSMVEVKRVLVECFISSAGAQPVPGVGSGSDVTGS